MRDNRLIVLAAVLAALLAWGCDDKKEGEANVDVSAKPTQEVAPSGELSKLAAPEDVVMFAGSDNLTALAGKLQAMAGPAGQSIKPESLAKGFATRFKLQDPSMIALDKPSRLVLFNPKTYKDGAIILTINDKAKLLGALSGKKDDVKRNAHAFQSAGGRTTYLNFLDDFAVFTNEPEMFTKYRAFLVKVCGAKVESGATGVIVAKHAAKIYKAELDEAIANAKRDLEAGTTMGPSLHGLGNIIEWVSKVAVDLDTITLHANSIEDGGKISVEVSGKGDSELEKTFKMLGGRKMALLNKLPADAPLVVAMSADPDAGSELTRSLTTWSLQLSLAQDLAEKYVEAMDAYWKASTGEIVFAGHMLEDKLRFSGISGIRDGEAARKAQATLREMYKDKSFAERSKEIGMSIKVKADAYKVGDVSVSTVETELIDAKDQQADDLKKVLGDKASLFSDLASSHYAYTDEYGFIAYGRDAKPVITAWLEGKVPGGFDAAPQLKRAQKHFAKGMFFMAYASPMQLIKHLSAGQMPIQLPNAQAGITLSAGAENGVLHLSLDLPASQAMALAMASMTLGSGL